MALPQVQRDSLLVEGNESFPTPPPALIRNHSIRKIPAGLENHQARLQLSAIS